MEYGIQMFGAKDEFLLDPETFFSKMQQMGYSLLEPIVTFENIEWASYFAWKEKEFEKYAPLMKKYGVSVLSAFAFVQNWKEALPPMLALVKKYKIRQMVIPCPSPTKEQSFTTLIEQLVKAGDKLKEVGCELLLHNDASVIEEQVNNQSLYENILELCNGSVAAQVDVGYVLQAGENVKSFLYRCKDMIKSIHYKDGIQIGDTWKEKAVGTGSLNVSEVFIFARENGLPQIMDQDSSEGNIMDDMKHAKTILHTCLFL